MQFWLRLKLRIVILNTIFCFDPETSWCSRHLSFWRDCLDGMCVHHNAIPSYQLRESMSLKVYEFREVLSSPWLKSGVVNSLSAGTHTLTYFVSELQIFWLPNRYRIVYSQSLIAAIYIHVVWKNNRKIIIKHRLN